MLPGAGSEPKLGGVAMGLKEGQTSGAIKGNQGIYFVKLVSKGAANTATDAEMTKTTLRNQTATQIRNGLVPSLVDAADIEDNRIEKLN